MKNLLIALLFACFLAAPTFAFSSGGTWVEIITRNHSNTISIPDKYVKEDGSLCLPLVVEILVPGKAPVVVSSDSFVVELTHLNLSGETQALISIGKEKLACTLYF